MADEQTIEQPEVQAPEQQDQQTPTPPQPTLPDDKKKELHGIVTKMILGGESEDNIKLVIDHYTKKFAAAPTGPLGTVIPKFAPAMQRPATDIQGARPIVQAVPLHYTSPFTAPMPQTVEEKHQSDVLAAHQRIVDEMPKTDAAIKNVIKSYKTQAQMAQFQTDLQNKGVDATAHPALLEHVQSLLPKAAIQVSDAEVQAYKDQMKDNPAMAREALYEHAKLNPDKAGQIAADTYLLDSQQRAGGTNTDQILKNAEAIKNGQNQYSIWHGGNVIKPEGFLESMARGFGERQKQFGDYDFLNSAKDEDIIKEYENRRSTPTNPDTPVPVASGFWGGFGQFAGAESPTMIKGAIPHILATGTGGVAEAIAPWVGGLVTSPDFYQRGYANSFNQNYNTLRNEGKSPQEALQIAKDRAAFDAREDVALGITMTAMGAKVGGAAAAEANLSPGFMNAVKGAAKTMVQSTPEAAGLGIAGGLAQVQKNINAGRPALEGVPEATITPIAFHYGVGLITTGGAGVKAGLYKSAVDNMARQPEDLVNQTLGEKVESNEITPQQANDAHLIIQNRKAQFDDLTNKAKEIVARGKVKGISAEPLQHAALNDHNQFIKYLQNIAEQAHDPKSEETTLDTYGQDLVNVAKQLYPKEEEFAEPEVPRETVSLGNNIEKAKGLLRQGIESGKIEKDYAPFEEHADHLLTYINDQSKGGKEKDMRSEFGDEMVDLAKEHAASQSTEIVPDQTYRTLNYGKHKGQPEDKEAQNAIKQQIVNDEPIGDTGEKFSMFLQRIIPGFKNLLDKGDHNSVLVTHSSVIKALKVWEEMGRPDISELTGDKLKDFAQKYVDLQPEAEGKVHTFKGEDGKEIHVVRHGETEDNKLSEFREDDTQLTDKGRSQAQRAGQQLQTALKGQPAAKIITSDLPRTIETSNIIRSELGTKPQEAAKTTEVSDTEKPNEAATALQGSYDRLIASGTDPNDPDMIKLKDKINSLTDKSKQDASSIRSNQGQGSGAGNATSGSQDQSGQNLQLSQEQEAKPTETQQQTGQEQPRQGGGPPEIDLPFVSEPGDESITGIRNSVTAQKIDEADLNPVLQEAARKHADVWQEALEKVKKGYDTQNLVDKLKKKPRPLTDTEDALLLIHQVAKESDLDAANREINAAAVKGDDAALAEAKIRRAKVKDDLQDLYNIDKSVGTLNARGLSARQMLSDRTYSLVNMEMEAKASQDGKALTEQQSAQIQTLYDRIKTAKLAYENRIAEVEAENKLLKAQKSVEKEKTATAEKPKKSKQDYSKERGDIVQQMRADLLKAAKGGEGLTASVPGVAQLKAIAPHVAKLVKSYVEQGVDNIEEITKNIKELLSPSIPGITDSHIHDLVAGVYDAKAPKEGEPVEDTGIRPVIKEQAKQMRYAVTDPQALKLRAAYEREKNSWLQSLKKQELAKRTTTEKLEDAFVKWERAFKLSNPITLGKLSAAAATRLALATPDELASGVFSKAFPKIASKAIGEGGFHIKGIGKAYKDAFTKGMDDAAQVAKTGKSDIDNVFGKKGDMPPEALDFFGQLHSALKAPVKRFAFEKSLQKRFTNEAANGVDISDPMVQSRIAVDAYKDANRSIFMQDNAVSKSWTGMISNMERNGYKGAAATAQWLVPFVKVPTNIVAETIQTTPIGLATSLTKIIYNAVKKTTDQLSSDEADTIMRGLKKGSMGTGLLLLGYMNPKTFGGYYQEGQKRDPKDPKWGSIKIGGVDIPAWMLESPVFQVMQLGATIRRVKDEKVSKTSSETKGLGEGLWAGATGMLAHEPLIDEPIRMGKLFSKPEERNYFLGELAKSTVSPALFDYAAKVTDPADARSWGAKFLDPENVRKPTNKGPITEVIKEHVMSGVPGLREMVSEKKKGKGTGNRN